MEKEKNCNCRFCQRNKKFKKFLKKYPFTKKDLGFLNELYEDLNMTEDNLEYREAILDGSWPQSVEILERHLKEAKTFRKRYLSEQERKNAERV